jgi:hypothetical protein
MLKGKRTIVLGLLVAIAGALQAVEATDWIELVGDQAAGAITSGIGVAIVVLRFFTSTPIGKAE